MTEEKCLRVAKSSGKTSRQQITLPDVRLYRRTASLCIRVLSRLGPVRLPSASQSFARRRLPRSRQNTAAAAGVRGLLNSSYLLLKSRTWRRPGRNSIETRRERWDRQRRRTAWDSAYSPLDPEIIYYPAPRPTRRYLYVITTSQPSEASGTLERLSSGAVMRHG